MMNYGEEKIPFSSSRSKTRKTWGHAIIYTVIALSLSGLYLRFSWNRYQDIASSEAVMLAESLESVFHPEHIEVLSGAQEDIEKPEYVMIKLSLTRLVKTANPIRFAYLMRERNGSIIILVDSESPDSDDYSPPGQIYEEAGGQLRSIFKSGKTLLSNPTADRWGTWISALVPINDPTSGKVLAVFGVDYSASEWYSRLWVRMIPDFMILICLLMLFYAFLRSQTQHSELKVLSKKIAFNEALYRSVFDQAPIGIAIVNDKNFVSQSEYGNLNINSMFGKIIGRNTQELFNIKWPEITHQEDLQADLEKFEQFQNGEIEGYSMEKRFLRPDGSSVWTNMKISPLQNGTDVQSMHLCLIEDISQRKAAEASLKESERSKSVLLSHLPGMAYRCKYDRDWTMQYVSDGCFELTGYAPESLINNRDLSYNDLITPEDSDLLWNEWKSILEKRLPFKYEYEITTAGGARKWVLELAEGIFDRQGEVEALEGLVIDISDRKEIENILRYNIDHDRWTGLYNRSYLENLLVSDAKKGYNEKRAVLGINLSAVQQLTTTYGFYYTQAIVKKIVDALIIHCTEKRQLFNTYENRFVFYVKDYIDTNELLEFSMTIAATLDLLLNKERIGYGIGITEIGMDNELDVNILFKNLLIASEKAINNYDKGLGACFYDTDMEREIIREQDIKNELAKIAAYENNGGLFLQYQPILDLKSNQICGFEALARLMTENYGLVSPLEFIPLAEKTKLILPMGRKVLLQAFCFLNKLKGKGYDKISISVNISAIQMLTDGFTNDLLKMIKEMNVCPDNIGIEITESVFSSSYEEINHILGELKDAGLHIAIDDFGTGYSTLAREQELNVDCLKIDKYFIDKLLEVHSDKAITADIISIAHKLGHYVIAEGVEHEKQKEYLLNNGCEMIQGYLVARPLDEDAAIERLEKQIDTNIEH